MFQVVNERYLHRRPMLFTTNKQLAAWGLVLLDPDLAEAILDRVLERGRARRATRRVVSYPAIAGYCDRHAQPDTLPRPLRSSRSP